MTVQPYLLLCAAAAWHAMSVGTVGLRGRIVAAILGAGFLWGLLTPPWGWVQIGAAVATVCGVRWAAGEGRPLVWWAVCQTARGLARVPALLADAVWSAILAVAPTPAHEAGSVERAETLSPPADSAAVVLPHGDRWGVLTARFGSGDSASGVTMTEQEILSQVAGKRLTWSQGEQLFTRVFRLSPSTFARRMRDFKMTQETA